MNQSLNNVFQFPRSVEGGANRFQLLRADLRDWVCKVIHKLRMPGAIRECDIDDPVTGHRIRVRIDRSCTELWIDGREYRFDRLSGKLRGTGTQLTQFAC